MSRHSEIKTNKFQVIDKIDCNNDYEFDWEHYKYYLDRIFFYKSSLIERDSTDHDEFWKFLKRYVTFQKQRSHQLSSNKSAKMSNRQDSNFDIPNTFSTKHKLNVMLNLRMDQTALSDMHGRSMFCL